MDNRLSFFDEQKTESKKVSFSDWQIIGHESQIKYLKFNITSGDLAHTYLFVGEEQIGKKKVALAFIKTIMCSADIKPCGKCNPCLQIEKGIHPDVSILEGSLSIKIENVRNIISTISLKPFSSPFKIAIIDNAERLTLESANALLKTLEEPPGQAIIILISNNSSNLLPTIVSRSRVVKFFRITNKDIEKILANKNIRREKNLILKIAMGKPGRVFNLIKDNEELEELENHFKNFIALLRGDRVKGLEYSSKLIKIYENDPELVINILSFWIIILRDIIYSKLNLQEKSIIDKYINRKSTDNFDVNNIINVIIYINSAREIISNPKSGFNIKLILDLIILNLEKIKI